MFRRFMLWFVMAGALFVFGASSVEASADAGTVVFVRHNFYVVETAKGYSVMEWYQEKELEEGDKVSGTFDQPGLQQLYNETAKRDFKVWIYDYWLTDEKAHQVLKERNVSDWQDPFRHE